MPREPFNVFGIIKESLFGLFSRPKSWGKIISVPLFLMILAFSIIIGAGSILGFGAEEVLEDTDLPTSNAGLAAAGIVAIGQFFLMLPVILLSLIIFSGAWVMLAVRTLSFAVRDEIPNHYFSFSWRARHWRLSGYIILIILAITLVMCLLIALCLTTEALTFFIIYEMILLGLLYMGVRLCLFMPSIAIGEGNPIKDSWRKTRGWVGPKMLLIFLFLSATAIIVTIIILPIANLIPGDTWFTEIATITIYIFASLLYGLLFLQTLGVIYREIS